jgi:hypothetical protein
MPGKDSKDIYSNPLIKNRKYLREGGNIIITKKFLNGAYRFIPLFFRSKFHIHEDYS